MNNNNCEPIFMNYKLDCSKPRIEINFCQRQPILSIFQFSWFNGKLQAVIVNKKDILPYVIKNCAIHMGGVSQ